MYNLSHLLLRRHTNLPVGGHHKSTFILHKSLLRGTSHSFFPEFTESFKGQAASLKGGGGGRGEGGTPLYMLLMCHCLVEFVVQQNVSVQF